MTNRKRRGYSLVEVIVALVLLDVGILALVGASASIVRLANEARLATRAAVAGAARRDQLIRSGCAGSASGSASDGPIDVTWSTDGNGYVVTVSRPVLGGRRVDTLAGRCVP